MRQKQFDNKCEQLKNKRACQDYKQYEHVKEQAIKRKSK